MAFIQLLVGPYARSIYLYGSRTFQQIATEYQQPVKEFAAKSFTVGQIQEAYNRGWVSQQEYDETMFIVGDNPFVLPQSIVKEEI